MFDGIPAIALKEVGATALVSFIVLLILLGGLIPRWMHKERMTDKDRQIAALQAALDKRDEQVDKLLGSNNLIIDLLQSIKREAERRRQ